MKSPLHILHLEDDSNDAALVQATLEAGGMSCSITCLESRVDFVAALERGGIDLILSDFSLPAFDGASALEIAHAKWPAIPLIFVSGTLGEEQAIDSLKGGAIDYVLKGRLSRLVPAVRRAMLEVEAHAQRERLEAQLRQAQKLEAVSRFAAGLAHDFNNFLSVISGYSQLLLRSMEKGSPLRPQVESILVAVDQAVDLTRQLLAFCRPRTLQFRVLDLNTAILNFEKLSHPIIRDAIKLVLELDAQVGGIRADAGQLDQVLMNLVVNARDAMPKGGTLSIKTANVEFSGSGGDPAGPYVLLAVGDTGCGMDANTQARLFEPFFTTKEEGKGTGLGLATVHGIVTQQGGWIDVRSDLGRGTCFNIYLRRIIDDVQVIPLVQPLRKSPPRSEPMLVIEQETSRSRI
jgi:signal transduction histidine kinase